MSMRSSFTDRRGPFSRRAGHGTSSRTWSYGTCRTSVPRSPRQRASAASSCAAMLSSREPTCWKLPLPKLIRTTGCRADQSHRSWTASPRNKGSFPSSSSLQMSRNRALPEAAGIATGSSACPLRAGATDSGFVNVAVPALPDFAEGLKADGLLRPAGNRHAAWMDRSGSASRRQTGGPSIWSDRPARLCHGSPVVLVGHRWASPSEGVD